MLKIDSPHKDTQIYLALSLGIFTVYWIAWSWLSDDAYITLRTVDNFINGYGLRWNVAERVQAYTHPLWMLLISSAAYLTKEVYFSTYIISFLCCLATILLCWKIFLASNNTPYFPVFILLLISSKGFFDYTSSGLENPLTFLILILFFCVCSKIFIFSTSHTRLTILTIICSFAFLNRQDSILLYLPIIVFEYFLAYKQGEQNKILKTLSSFLIGIIPAASWLIFSIIYYGFPFPNTAYAKLNTGLTYSDLIPQGFSYLSNSLFFDPITVLVISIGVFVALLQKVNSFRMYGLGIILYLIYTIIIGGDFMSGRFLATPFLLSIIIIFTLIDEPKFKIFLIVFLVLIGQLTKYSPLRFPRDYPKNIPPSYGIADERSFYFHDTGLIFWSRNREMPAHQRYQEGKDFRFSADKVIVSGFVGFYGFGAGPSKFIIDYNALTDPFLARLPSAVAVSRIQGNPTRYIWRIGHYERMLPVGYIESLDNKNQFVKNISLNEYYSALKEVIAGPIWSIDRFKKIIDFNLGYYDHLVEDSVKPIKKKIIEIQNEKFADTGIEFGALDILKITFPTPRNINITNLELTASDAFRVTFFQDENILWQEVLGPLNKIKEFHNYSLEFNPELISINNITIEAVSGNMKYKIRSLNTND